MIARSRIPAEPVQSDAAGGVEGAGTQSFVDWTPACAGEQEAL